MICEKPALTFEALLQAEEWGWIPGFEGMYQVSDCGRVRGVDRWVPVNGGQKLVKGTTLKIFPRVTDRAGWGDRLTVALCKGSKYHYLLIHLLVLRVFHGSPPTKHYQGLHKDDNPDNNTKENLYWGTRSDNARDCFRNRPEVNLARRITFLSNKGRPTTPLRPVQPSQRSYTRTARTRSKLTEPEVREIIEAARQGEIPSRIHRRYSWVDYTAVLNVCNGVTWKHIPR